MIFEEEWFANPSDDTCSSRSPLDRRALRWRRLPAVCHRMPSRLPRTDGAPPGVPRHGASIHLWSITSILDGSAQKIEEIKTSDISPIQTNLLALLTSGDVLDLVAYVLSDGDQASKDFRKLVANESLAKGP